MTVHIALSGGLDSTAALAFIMAPGSRFARGEEPVRTYSFDYGQKHARRELDAAVQVATHYGLGLSHYQFVLPALASPALVGEQPVPHGHYADESMKATVVAGRNLLLIANLVAKAQPGDTVVIGVHAGDHAIYPDCRPDFILPLRDAIDAGYGVGLVAPWLYKSKADIVIEGSRYGAPFHLTWSCYEGGGVHCGECGTCYERREAFQLAGVADPTVYREA